MERGATGEPALSRRRRISYRRSPWHDEQPQPQPRHTDTALLSRALRCARPGHVLARRISFARERARVCWSGVVAVAMECAHFHREPRGQTRIEENTRREKERGRSTKVHAHETRLAVVAPLHSVPSAAHSATLQRRLRSVQRTGWLSLCSPRIEELRLAFVSKQDYRGLARDATMSSVSLARWNLLIGNCTRKRTATDLLSNERVSERFTHGFLENTSLVVTFTLLHYRRERFRSTPCVWTAYREIADPLTEFVSFNR